MMKKYWFSIILLMGLSPFIAQAQNFKSQKVSFKVTTVQSSLKNPWAMVWLNASQGLITERNGDILFFDLENQERKKLSVPSSVYQSGQGGLLDLAIDPDYSRNGWIYLTFSLRKGIKNTTALARFKLVNHRMNSFQTLFEAQPLTTGGYHFGSRIVFSQGEGPPSLFMTVGERNLREPAQDPKNHVGKVIRFDYQKNFQPEVYSYGHRNPQGMVWDKLTGRLLANEHGARGGDEINIVERGKNYGWPIISYGRNYDGSKIGVGTSKTGMEQPMYYWDPSIAPSGFVVYNGKEFPEWEGDLLVGSLKFGLLVRLELNSTRDRVVKEERMLDNQLGRIRYIGVGKQGEIYLLSDSSNGKLYRIDRI